MLKKRYGQSVEETTAPILETSEAYRATIGTFGPKKDRQFVDLFVSLEQVKARLKLGTDKWATINQLAGLSPEHGGVVLKEKRNVIMFREEDMVEIVGWTEELWYFLGAREISCNMILDVEDGCKVFLGDFDEGVKNMPPFPSLDHRLHRLPGVCYSDFEDVDGN